MNENRSKPDLDDYRSMMCHTHAPSHLQDDVLKQAARVRADQASANPCTAPVQTRSRTHPKSTPRPSLRSGIDSESVAAATRRRAFRPAIAAAACLMLAVSLVAAGSAIGWPGDTLLGSSGSAAAEGNSFVLAAYAAENPESAPGKAVLLDSSQFYGGGGNSGRWYNPADQTFWDYPWVGYKYHFFLNCTGNNIKTLTYEIEGERSYFEIIDRKIGLMSNEERKEGEHVFNYSKTFTFDYDNQESIMDERAVSLYIGYPLSDSGMQALSDLYAGDQTGKANKQLDVAHEVGAAQEIRKSRLKLTATFADGSTQTKTFVIAPIDDFEETYSNYWDAREKTLDNDGAKRPDQPKLYTITEIAEAQ